MIYVALLRGINVGGRNITKMAALRACLENAGFARVETFIQSGNVVFESARKSAAKLAPEIDAATESALGINPRVVVLSRDRLKTVLSDAPAAWRSRTDLRMNIAFLRPPVTVAAALKEVDVRPGVDSVEGGTGVLYPVDGAPGSWKEPDVPDRDEACVSGDDDSKLRHLSQDSDADGSPMSEACAG